MNLRKIFDASKLDSLKEGTMIRYRNNSGAEATAPLVFTGESSFIVKEGKQNVKYPRKNFISSVEADRKNAIKSLNKTLKPLIRQYDVDYYTLWENANSLVEDVNGAESDFNPESDEAPDYITQSIDDYNKSYDELIALREDIFSKLSQYDLDIDDVAPGSFLCSDEPAPAELTLPMSLSDLGFPRRINCPY